MNKSARNKPPMVYVIAGPNSAGKTTYASEFLPDFVDCRQFLNADLIAAGLSPFDPETQNVKAGRLLWSGWANSPRTAKISDSKRPLRAAPTPAS